MASEGQQTGGPRSSGMPMLGLGTWENTEPDACANAVATALEMGYRHIDTAQIYGNEESVGEGLAAADVPREDIFLATKVWIDNLAPTDVHESTQESLEKLGTEYVDLLYIHWPAREYDPEGTLRAFEELQDDGVIDRIGVSNFEPADLDRAVEILEEPPFANQIEIHPLLQQRELRSVCADLDIELVAYSPLARGQVLENEVLSDIAEAHDASSPQVALAWLREHGLRAIPKATSRAHIADNWASLDLQLTESEVQRIDELDRQDRQVDPSWAPWRD